jgi:hypothetical protein
VTYFTKKTSDERAKTMRRVMTRLEKEQSDEDTPPVDMNDILSMLRKIVDHLHKLEEELEIVIEEE